MEREKVDLSGARETMLATLYAKALDSRAERPVLGDPVADEVVRRIDYDFGRTGIKASTAAGVALRTRHLDTWTAEFLAEHDEATVLHLACGLDARWHRLRPDASVRWYDLDHPEVLDLRRRLIPEAGGDYHAIAGSVTDEGWLDQIPDDRPAVAVFEGLSMYLREEEGKRLIQGIASRFPEGQLLFDCYGSMGIRMQKGVTAVRNSGATLHWGIDDPYALESWHEGLTCQDAPRYWELPGVGELPRSERATLRVLSVLPGMRNIGRILRYRF